MRKIVLYIAASLNGKIAKPDGSVDWLDSAPNPENLDYGYYDFYKSIGTTIMGNSTYQQLIDWEIDFPYPDKENFVLTRKDNMLDTEHVKFITDDHIEFISTLKSKEGSDIWLVGGSLVNTALLNAGLIDQIILFTIPIVLTDGIDIFGDIPAETILKLTDTKSYSTGMISSTYTIEK